MAASSASEYIKHHLGNLTYGRLPEGYERLDHHGDVVETLETSTWTFAHNGQEAVDMGFMAFHVDSLAWAGGLGINLFSADTVILYDSELLEWKISK